MKGVKKSFGRKFRTCRLRKKYGNMNFSYEEIYSMYGQYDTFVSLDFHQGSEAYNKFGQSLMGTFKYTLEQRKELEQLLKLKHIPRSSKRILFSPSILHNLSEEQKVFLDKDGILNDDIACVSSVSRPRKNAYIENGKKEIPNQIKIGINISEKESHMMMFGLYKSKLKDGCVLSNVEKNDFYALKQYFEPNNITAEDLRYIIDNKTNQQKLPIREKYLKIKSCYVGLTDEERKEIHDIWHIQLKEKEAILKNEIQRADSNWNNLPFEQQLKLLCIAYRFEDEVLLSWSKSIWWDLERFLHIVIRHTADLQNGNYKEKTTFQYDFSDIRNLVISVIASAQKEIEEEFKVNPNKNFKRQGKRAIYFNGNYYRVEIEPSGRLLTFHPYNDEKEREKDNN